MAQDALMNLVASINHSTTTKALADALRQVKNNLIGHVQKKEAAVKAGLVVPLASIICDASTHSTNGASRSSSVLSDHEQNQVQATTIISILAAGGSQFVPPLVASNIDTHLLSNISLDQHPALVTASLQALCNIAESHLQDFTNEAYLNLITSESVSLLDSLLRQQHSVTSPKQKQLVCELIAASAAQRDDVKDLLVSTRVLDTLAAVLVVASNDSTADKSAATSPSALHPQLFSKALAAVCAIVSGSCYRTSRFIHSPSIDDWSSKFRVSRQDLRHMYSSRSHTIESAATLLPTLHIPVQKSVSFQPALSSSDPAFEQDEGDTDHVNAVVGRLINSARNLSGVDRLMVLRLVALVEAAAITSASFRPQTTNRQKRGECHKQLAVLAVPLAARLVQDSLDIRQDNPQGSDCQIKEEACEVLALLIDHNKELQSAAVEAGAIKNVCTALRRSFESIKPSKPIWSPQAVQDSSESPNTHKLGPPGIPPEVSHVMKCRRGALSAIAALADKDDNHRKAIVAANVVTYIIEALKPLSLSAEHGPRKPIEGNTTAVMVAACRSATSISRSVASLRTSLIDAGIAAPILRLIQDSELDVQIAATDVCANLVLEFSPMKEDLLASGVDKALCAHAKTGPAALRLPSLWALKHLMPQTSVELRLSVLSELGADWLMNVAMGDETESYNAIQGGGVALSSANAAGEQIDLLNPSSMEIDGPLDGDQAISEDAVDYDEEDGELLYDEASKTHYQSSSMRSTLRAPPSKLNVQKYLEDIKYRERDAHLLNKIASLNIQVQALDFIRNFFHGDHCATMIDHAFQRIGSDRLFALLLSKISPLQSRGRSDPTSYTTTIYHTCEVVNSALNVMIHIANGNAAHKEALIGYRGLFEAVQPHFSHHDPHIRVACVWLVNSLTWLDDTSDKAAAKRRANELRQLGIETAVKRLANDPDRDVKERVKTALSQFETL